MKTRDTSREHELLQQIVGEQLSSVEFVQDYVQLRFDGPVLTAFNWPTVKVGQRDFRWDEPGFRDELCRRIGRKVVSATVSPGEGLSLSFDDGAVVRISLVRDDYRGPEAIEFVVDQTRWWVL